MSDQIRLIVRLLGAVLGLMFFAWVIGVSLAGPAAMDQLKDFEQQAAQVQEEYQQVAREELRDAVLAEDGWGSEAHVDMPQAAGNLRQEALDMMDEAEEGWGVGSR